MELLTKEEVFKEKENKIIIALDNETSEGMSMVEKIEDNDELKEMRYGYKVGSLWILEEGLNVIDDLHNSISDDCAVILDMQKWSTDVPSVVKKQVDKVADMGRVNELIGCPMGGGIKSLEAFIDRCQDNCIRPIIVLEMTHPGADAWLLPGYYMSILNIAAENSVDAFVIPATKTPRLEIKETLDSKYSDLDYEFYTTGYKTQGGQAKPMIEYGVKKFIVGSYIYDSENIEVAIRNTYNDINDIPSKE